MQIKIMRKQGQSLRAIACELGCAVNTVRKYLEDDVPPAYPVREHRRSKLAPFADYLQRRINAAAPDWIPATVLWREIREQGYAGGERIVRTYVATLRPVKTPDPLVRFETGPGDQMQVDWIEFRRRKGASYVEFVADMRLETLLACHANGFD